ncbi:hypothetical protein HYE67_004678 [Fusarium culmorum]|uniref:Uncharacterized protein n=1 Tax=Fusarium culmorum TaxID=5516 RepID=A0A7S8D5N1_FUSCU|nr:hypothetical protein HYE67_004678 [Fusarium culmorum]
MSTLLPPICWSRPVDGEARRRRSKAFCDGFNLKGRCKTACYPYTNTPVAINGDGLKGPIASGKTDTDCKCTLGKDHGSCMLVKSNKKGTNAPNHCLTSIAFAQCQRA